MEGVYSMENKQQQIQQLKEKLEKAQNRKDRIRLKLKIFRLETENK